MWELLKRLKKVVLKLFSIYKALYLKFKVVLWIIENILLVVLFEMSFTILIKFFSFLQTQISRIDFLNFITFFQCLRLQSQILEYKVYVILSVQVLEVIVVKGAFNLQDLMAVFAFATKLTALFVVKEDFQ